MTRGRLLINTLYLSCALLSCLAAPAFATNITWKAASTGSWNIATNWLPNQVPGVNDVAIITAAGTYDVNINGNVSVNAINLGSNARLKVNSVTLTASTGIAVGASSTLELNSGTLSGGGVSLNGKLSGTGNVNSALTTATTSTIEVGAGSLTVANGFTNLGLLSFPATGTRTFFVTNGTFTNAAGGMVSCATTGSLIAQFNNQGSIISTGGQGFLTLGKSGATNTNSGPMTAAGGAYLILNGFGDTINTSGSLTADALSILRVSGGVFNHTGGTISGSGNFEVVETTSATFASNPTTAVLYLAGDGIAFPSGLVNGAAQQIVLGDGADVTAPQLTNQVGYSLAASEGAVALHVVTFFNLGNYFAPRSFLLDCNLNCGPASSISIGIGGTTPGTDFDQMVVTGAAQLGGAIFFNLENGYFPSPGDRFDVLTSPAHFDLFQMNGWELGNDMCLIADPGVTSSESHPYTIRAVRQKWTSIPTIGQTPPSRRGHSAVYAPAHDFMLVFGGQNGSGQMLNDVWRLTFPGGIFSGYAIWDEMHPSGTPPLARKGHSAVYDAFTNRMIVFGGESDSSGYLSDIWVLTNADHTTADPQEWVKLPSFPGVSERSGHAIGYNPTSNRMVMSQGGLYCDPAYGDMWVLDHANGLGISTGWTSWSISGVPPSPRRDAIHAYDVNGNRLLVYGGRTPCGAVKSDAFVLSDADGAPDVGPRWDPLGAGASPALPGRSGAPGVYDYFYDRLIAFGGLMADGTSYSSGITVLAGTRGVSGWTELPVPTTHPSARAFHSMVYRPGANTWVVFGGDANGTFMSDVWTLELEGDTPQVSGIDPGPIVSKKPRVLAFSMGPTPNPSSHGMQFSVRSAEDVNGHVVIYDALGRRVHTIFDGRIVAGEHRFEWPGQVASGIYFVALESGQTREVRRVVVAH